MTKFFKNGLAFGHIIECFDNTLYEFFSLILAPIFFPSTDTLTGMLSSFGAFAAGFITKPLGALVFGILGDSTNRTLPLILSITLVGIPTLIIGLLPSYETIGLMAPILLVICRLLQGFFFGGEFPRANVYIYETSPKNDLGKYTGFFIASGVIGAIIATLAGLVTCLQLFPPWSWRVPFIVGGILAIFSFRLRRKMDHLPSFSSSDSTYLSSLSLLFKKYKRSVTFSILLSGLTAIPLNLAKVYANMIFHQLGCSSAQCMALDGAAMIINAAFLIMSGRLADKIGFIRTIEWGIIANIIIAFPAFWVLFASSGSLLNALAFILLLMGAGTVINGCTFPYMASLFPSSCQSSGLSISYTIGIALLSGTSPLIAVLITYYFHSIIGVSGYVILVSVVTLVAHGVLILKRPEFHPHLINHNI